MEFSEYLVRWAEVWGKTIYCEGVKEFIFIRNDIAPHLLQLVQQDFDPVSNPSGNGFQSLRPMPNPEHCWHVRKEILCCANVARRFIPSNVLFASLHWHSICRIAMNVFRYADNATWHFSFELISTGNVSRMWTTKAHWNSKTLHTTHRNICIHFACWLSYRCR